MKPIKQALESILVKQGCTVIRGAGGHDDG